MGKGAFAYFSTDLLPGGHLQAQPEQEELGGVFGTEISTFWVSGVNCGSCLSSLFSHTDSTWEDHVWKECVASTQVTTLRNAYCVQRIALCLGAVRESLGEYSLVHENPDIKTSLRGFGAQTLVIVFITEI